MNKKSLTDIRIIKEAIDTKKLVVFAGAGVSIDAGVPLWGELIQELKKDVEIPTGETDALRIAQMYFNERDEKEYLDKIRQILKHKKITFNTLHEAVFELEPEHLLTTNFDDLFEQAIQAKALPFSVVKRDSDFPYAVNTNLLVKVHGDLELGNLVLKEDDYLNFNAEHPLIESFTKSVFASKVVLFVGYSFSDINLKYLLQNVRAILGKNFQNAYLLSPDPVPAPQRHYLKCKGVVVISYGDFISNKSGTAEENIVDRFLRGSNARNRHYYRAVPSLSPRGQRLYDLIRFITHYNFFEEQQQELNIVEQMHNSLMRFKELKSLPPEFIAGLFPFNTNKESKSYHYRNYTLLTQNAKIIDLFFQHVTVEGSMVELSKDYVSGEQQLKQYEQQLLEVCKRLNNSVIFCIAREGKTPDSFGNKGWSNECAEIYVELEKECDCLKCKFKKLKLNKALREVRNRVITETTLPREDLMLAYVNYKLGNFETSFKQFDEIASKAWRSGNFMIYFITKLNAKRLRNLIRIDNLIHETSKEEILDKIEIINDDQLLFQLSFLPKEQYHLLKEVNSDRILRRAEAEINKNYNKIKAAHKMYRGGGTVYSSPHYGKAIELELLRLIAFYEDNFIVLDEYTDFSEVCEKAIKALIVNYSTHKDYEFRLKSFSSFILSVIVFYANPERLQKDLDAYKVEVIELEEEALDELSALIVNVLKSHYRINTFLGRSVSPEEYTSSQLYSHFFSDKCRTLLNNLLVLLSRIPLTEVQAAQVIESLLDFLTVEDVLNWTDVKYLTRFLYQHGSLFKENDFDQLLDIASKKFIYFHDGEFLHAIKYASDQKQIDYSLKNKVVYERVVGHFEDKSKCKFEDMFSLWPLLDDSLKQQLKDKIEVSLVENFNQNLYYSAALMGIVDYKLFLEKYAKIACEGHDGYKIRNETYIPHSYEFYNFALFIYRIDVPLDGKMLDNCNNPAEHMKFILNPEQYDYTNFNPEWLIVYKDKHFMKKLKNVAAVKEHLEEFLKRHPSSKLTKTYCEFFL